MILDIVIITFPVADTRSEMKVVIALMLVTGAYCHPVKEMLLGDANTVDDLVDSYFTITVSTARALPWTNNRDLNTCPVMAAKRSITKLQK